MACRRLEGAHRIQGREMAGARLSFPEPSGSIAALLRSDVPRHFSHDREDGGARQ
jgi:hypothetical protein